MRNSLTQWTGSTHQTVSAAMIATAKDAYAEWKTPQRSNTSSWKCVYLGLRYVLRTLGLSLPHLRQLSFVLKRNFLQWAGEDLVARYGRVHPVAAEATKQAEAFGLMPPPGMNNNVSLKMPTHFRSKSGACATDAHSDRFKASANWMFSIGKVSSERERCWQSEGFRT